MFNYFISVFTLRDHGHVIFFRFGWTGDVPCICERGKIGYVIQHQCGKQSCSVRRMKIANFSIKKLPQILPFGCLRGSVSSLESFHRPVWSNSPFVCNHHSFSQWSCPPFSSERCVGQLIGLTVRCSPLCLHFWSVDVLVWRSFQKCSLISLDSSVQNQ